MSSSDSWAELAEVFCQTRAAFLDHERAKTELKILMPEDAKEAFGHGIHTKRSPKGKGNAPVCADWHCPLSEKTSPILAVGHQ
jgi:hypothetical protein